MTLELWMLMGSVLVLFGTIVVQVLIALGNIGLVSAMGNRTDVAYPPPGIAGRAERAVRNTVYALAMFAPVVLTAKVAGISTDMTVLGAQLFFYARIAYSIVYIAGIPWLRTAVWSASMIGIGMVMLALMG
jgi:uncharacterized MAPEG superfamily protein